MLNVRTCWISDLHLGSTQCQADRLLEFIKLLNTEKLYLVGDIIDFWALSRKSYWPEEHNTVIQKILRMARHDVEVIYVPGNHDSPVRDLDRMHFGNVEVRNEDIHTLADGRKLLVIHGDQFDPTFKYYRLVAKLGSIGYDLLLDLNRFVRWTQRLFGLQSHFSLSAYIKHRVKNIVQFVSQYEIGVVHMIKDYGVDGIVCGHIHKPELKTIDGLIYANDGDFVESLSALVENHDGTLELIFLKDLIHEH